MKPLDNEAEKLINSIGCLAELLTVFYNALQKGGFTRDQAFILSSNLLDIMTDSMIDFYDAESEE